MRMGEVVLSSEAGMEIELEKKDGSSEVFGWDRFLPRMVLRVLLVEADDSTRQIISALLRKCSYRVSAVPDGLMAWETLKGQAHNIDLVLTEVELPSISGFALLTLAMEHEICKKIPVIMMSSHDSISMVFKCMLKGAADFLIKPVRRNELRNLWQHVWRRHSNQLLDGHIPQNLPIIQPKAEANSENNAASNHSSDSKQKSKDKGSDAQSSCTSPYLEAESAYMQNMQGLSNLKCRSSSNLSYKDKEKNEECIKLEKKSFGPDSKTGGASDELIVSERFRSGSEAAPCSEAYTSTVLIVEEDSTSDKTMPQGEGMEPNNDRGNSNITSGIHKYNDELIEPSQGAIDLIGTFDNHRKSTNGQSTFSDGINKFEFAPQLELSLRKFVSSSSKDQGTDERHTLNHSTASAFSWYNNSKTFPTPGESFRKLKDDACKSQVLSTQLYDNATRTSQPYGATLSNSQDYMTSLVIGQSEQSEVTFPRAQLGLISVPGVRFDNIFAGYTHVFPPLFYPQSGLSGVWSPKSPCQREQSPFPSCTSVHSNPDTHDLEGYRRSDETTNNSIDQNACEQNNMEPLEGLRHSSPAAGQSACSSLCNGFGNNHNAGTSGAGGVSSRIDGNTALSDPVEKVTGPDSRNGGTLFIHDGFRGIDSQRSSRRQAALTKFRLKRKDRCFEKKVRYQSRKNLAEQRPRVKGQFVRQVRSDTTSTVSNADTGP